jgi:hypothetical protein
MNDEKTVDVRVQILLPADLYFPDAAEPVESVRLEDSTNLQVTLRKSGNALESLLNSLRKEESKYRTKIRKIERTLIVPDIEIVLKGRVFRRGELVVKHGKLFIPRDDPSKCNWYKATRDIVFAHNSLIDELFQMCPDEPWQRIETPRFITSSDSINFSDFPLCLNFWNIEFKETSKQKWHRVSHFDFEPELEKERSSQVASVDIDLKKLENIHDALRAIRQSRARLPIGWEYLYHATRYLDEGNIRNAVIDLDIAVDFAVRKRVRNNIDLEEKYIGKILDKCSTGDLLLIAQTHARNQSELKNWGALRELHALRGTVIHRYQRRFSDTQLETIESARSSIISILRDLGTA